MGNGQVVDVLLSCQLLSSYCKIWGEQLRESAKQSVSIIFGKTKLVGDLERDGHGK